MKTTRILAILALLSAPSIAKTETEWTEIKASNGVKVTVATDDFSDQSQYTVKTYVFFDQKTDQPPIVRKRLEVCVMR